MKLALITLFLSLLFVPCAAQSSECNLPKQPQLFNLSLGISAEQTQAVVGKNLKIKIKKKGQQTFFQNFIEKPPPQSLTGVRALYLRFFDSRLYQIEIFYEERSDAKTLDEFITPLSVQLNFPAATWKIEKGMAMINCDNISLVADNVLNPRIEITDQTVSAKVEELKQKSKK